MEPRQQGGPRPPVGGDSTLLEVGFPFREVSDVIAADQRVRDPRYLVHRWFARRPPALLRAALLAARLPANEAAALWDRYAEPEPWLSDVRVHDPFAGGGSTLVEADRLGAMVSGGDVDPVAVTLSRHLLAPPPREDLLEPMAQLLAHLRERLADVYPVEGDVIPLHYFTVARVSCPDCGVEDLLYRDLLLARDVGKVGSVVRGGRKQIAFCPDCLGIHDLPVSRKTVQCCGRRRPLGTGTFVGVSYTCGSCRRRSSLQALSAGTAPRVLVGVEETTASGRRIRPATMQDHERMTLATEVLAAEHGLPLADGAFPTHRRDQRPTSFGITSYRDLFNDRQLLTFGHAFKWINEASLEEPLRRALWLATSNALATNNRLCGYARDYGRLSALFSVRGYSLPLLAVELNPLHPSAGRGTLPRVLERMLRASSDSVRRYTYDRQTERVKAAALTFPFRTDGVVHHVSADVDEAASAVDVVGTDPPYFDYIDYDELSAFYRAWWPNAALGGVPILPSREEDRVEEFGLRLGQAFKRSMDRLRPGGLLFFTYHSQHAAAWDAIGFALDEAKARVTALWPVRSDPNMGHHGMTGSCDYDLLVVLRPMDQSNAAVPTAGVGEDAVARWIDSLGLDYGVADSANFRHAFLTCSPRWGSTALTDHEQAGVSDEQ